MEETSMDELMTALSVRGAYVEDVSADVVTVAMKIRTKEGCIGFVYVGETVEVRGDRFHAMVGAGRIWANGEYKVSGYTLDELALACVSAVNLYYVHDDILDYELGLVSND